MSISPAGSGGGQQLPSYIAAMMDAVERVTSSTAKLVKDARPSGDSQVAANFGPQNNRGKGENVSETA